MPTATELSLPELAATIAGKNGLGYIEYDGDTPTVWSDGGQGIRPSLCYHPGENTVVISGIEESRANALKQRLGIHGVAARQSESGGPLTVTINSHAGMDILGTEIEREFRHREPATPKSPPEGRIDCRQHEREMNEIGGQLAKAPHDGPW